MMIELSKEQYKKLLFLVYLGEWVANSYKIDEEYEFTDIEQYIYFFYNQFGCEDLIQYDEEENLYLPTKKFDKLAAEYLEEFLIANEDDFISFN